MSDVVVRLLFVGGRHEAHRGEAVERAGSLVVSLGQAGYVVESISGCGGQWPEAVRSTAEAAWMVRQADGVVVDVGMTSEPGLSVVLRAARHAGVPALLFWPDPTGETVRVSDRGLEKSKALASHVIESRDLGRCGDGAWRSVMEQVGLRLGPAPQNGVAPLALRDSDEVSVIHSDAFPDSSVTQLGSRVVRRYYKWQFIGPHPAPLALGAWRDGRLVGFVFGGLRYKAIAGFARHSLGTIALGSVTHPRALTTLAVPQVSNVARLMARRPSPAPLPGESASAERLPASSDGAFAAPSFGILSIAVAPEHQGSGVARELLDGATEGATSAGFERMHLTVGVENARAIAFYEKSGWERDPAGPAWGGRMVRSLTG